MKIGLVGSTNVGKSTLFNRLIGQFRAIVTDIPGTTTDIIKHKLHLENGGVLQFFDSPGLLDFTDELPYISKIVQDSDFLLFLVDDSVGVTAKEQHILELIRSEEKQDKTLLIINKLDVKWKEHQYDLAVADYYDLGIPNIIGISAKLENNLSEIEDALMKIYKQRKQEHPDGGEEVEEERIGLAIIGKPNAGKSTLLNTLVKEELAKVEDTAGTTRDYLAGDFEWRGKKFTAFDTAGIRKKGSIHGIEKIAYDKTKAMLEYTRPIVVFMVDCTQGITHRDMTLLQEIHTLALPIIFALNKADLVNPKGLEAMLRNAQSYLEFAKYIPIVTMTALEGRGVEEVMKMVGKLQQENTKRIQTRELNKAVQQEMIMRPPRFPKNKIVKILYATQIAVDAPTFVIFVNHKSRVNFAFKKWLENTIRRHFGFVGVPIVVKYRNRGENGMEREILVKYNEEEAEQLEEAGNEGAEASSNNPYHRKKSGMKKADQLNNKGKRKREKTDNKGEERGRSEVKIKQAKVDVSKQRLEERRKREGKYTNVKKGDQKKLNEMFSKVYGEKNLDKNKKINKRRYMKK
ncbi:MAG: ribosome biogenesis GTPase Der [Candidatus Absconditabacteria bacterium]|nr:ribosome biogenesis GTPase Der [Candidatus Absconditabacteria bacterium]MDD3868657.1 ribosome biogenesis GTPase Der [Candidatus Absconditabacteria bacterium]MDD4714492.1 ribosome biogenesis GTPase Der [Candidatus Absconditabacteria bacterium]